MSDPSQKKPCICIGKKLSRPKIFSLIILIFVILCTLVIIEIFPMQITKKYEGELKIGDNLSANEIAGILKKEKFIIDPKGFLVILSFYRDDSFFKSGTHKLAGINNVFSLIGQLQKPGLPEEISVTFPEGFTVKDIANRLKENSIISDENAFLEFAKNYEGYLFPDTYKFVKGESFESIVSKMNNRFKEITSSDFETLCEGKGFSEKEAVILASIVEKEAKFDKDRALVASVFINRLRIDMPLQADSTINYILPQHKEWLSKEDYEIDSPYNTYKYPGFPPSPICNPGKASLYAVIEAPQTDYYYFMTKPDGEAVFAKTLAEHERNLAKYYGD